MRVSILKKWLNNMKNRIWFPYVVIWMVVLVLEVFFFNFSTWKTMGCEPIVLAQDVCTDEQGVYSTGFTDIYADIKNVNVDLHIERYDKAEVTVSLTDAGDYYAYDMPAYTVTNDVKGSGYQNIYPFGTVGTLQVRVTVPEGTKAQIESVALNVQRPFAFKILRVLVLFAVVSFGYALCSVKGVGAELCKRRSKTQLGVITGVVVILFALAALLATSNPVCVNSPWPHHRQYQELARALKDGTVVIGEEPDAALVAKENPYDTGALLAEGIPFKMDYAYYDGNYYAYFGIVPELMFYLPYYLLTGKDLQNYMVVFALYCGLVIGVFGALWELIHKYAKKASFLLYLLLSVSVCLLPHYISMVARPDIYNVPVMAGNAFIWLGTWCWLKAGNRSCDRTESAKNSQRTRGFWYGLGAFFMASIMGCRPQMILYGILLFAVLLLPDIWKGQKEWKQHMGLLLAFCVPFVIVGAVVFWYNYARFGSGFAFGASYSLTSNDMNNRGVNFSRILYGLYAFIFQPIVVNAKYPFLESAQLACSYMGKHIYEFSYGGMLWVYPLVISLIYVAMGGWKQFTKQQKGFIGGLCAVSFVVASFDITAAGILQRYMCDMALGFALAAVLVFLILADRYEGSATGLWIKKTCYLCVCASVVVAFLVVITSCDSICLENYNPKLFYTMAEYFKF